MGYPHGYGNPHFRSVWSARQTLCRFTRDLWPLSTPGCWGPLETLHQPTHESFANHRLRQRECWENAERMLSWLQLVPVVAYLPWKKSVSWVKTFGENSASGLKMICTRIHDGHDMYRMLLYFRDGPAPHPESRGETQPEGVVQSGCACAGRKTLRSRSVVLPEWGP